MSVTQVNEETSSNTPPKFRTPDGYTSDIAVFTVEADSELEATFPSLKLLLIKRSALNKEGEPNVEGGKWALPGGFVNPDETAGVAAIRELSEETGVEGITVHHYAVYDQPGRDPRGWIISNAHYAIVDDNYLEKRKAADDAEVVELFTIDEVMKLELAFDHRTIIEDAIKQVKSDLLKRTEAGN